MKHGDIHPQANRICPEWAQWLDYRHVAVQCLTCTCTYTLETWSIYLNGGGWVGGIPRGACMSCEWVKAEDERRALPIQQHLVDAVKKFAVDHYESGWDEVVECWDDEDIWEQIAGTKDAEHAILEMGKCVDLRNERRNEVRATRW